MTEKKKVTQLERFKQAARELGCEDDEQTFDATLKKVASAKVARPKGKAKETKAK